MLAADEEEVVAHEVRIHMPDAGARLAKAALQRRQQERERRGALLAVDDRQAGHAAAVVGVHRIQQRADEMRVGSTSGAEDVPPQLVALILAP